MPVRRALALSLVVPLLLAGCAEDQPEPKMPDPSPSSSSPSPTESETAEVESPEDFIARWVESNTAMQNTGEVDEYATLVENCKSCLQTVDRIRSIYANGGYVKTDGWKIRKVTDRSGDSGRRVFDLSIDSAPTEFKESASSEVESYEGGDIVVRVRLNGDAPWQVVQVTQVPS